MKEQKDVEQYRSERDPEYLINVSLSMESSSYFLRNGQPISEAVLVCSPPTQEIERGVGDASVDLFGHQTVNLRRQKTDGGHRYTVYMSYNNSNNNNDQPKDDLMLLDWTDKEPCVVNHVAISCGRTLLDVERLHLLTDKQQQTLLSTEENEKAAEKAEAAAKKA